MDTYPGTRVPLTAPLEEHIQGAISRGFRAFGFETLNSFYLVIEMPSATVSVTKVGEKNRGPAIIPGQPMFGDWWEIQYVQTEGMSGEVFFLFARGRQIFHSSLIQRKVGLKEGQTRCASFLERT